MALLDAPDLPASEAQRVIEEEKHSEKTSISLVEDSFRPLEGRVSAVDGQKLLRKLDLKLVPWCCLLYLLSFLDRKSFSRLIAVVM